MHVIKNSVQGCHSQGKKIFFQDHGKVREFCYKSVKIRFFEKSGKISLGQGNFKISFNFLLILYSIYLFLS